MPNTRLYGFRWIEPLTVHDVAEPIRCRVVTTAPQALNVGDPVALRATGYVDLCIAAEANLFGVIVGIGPYFDGVRMTYGTRLPAATAYVNPDQESTVFVQPAANNVFEVCCGTQLAVATRAGYIASVGENCDHMVTAVAPLNWPELNAAAIAGAATAQWRVIDVGRTPYIDWANLYVPLLVSGNEVVLPPATPLAGI